MQQDGVVTRGAERAPGFVGDREFGEYAAVLARERVGRMEGLVARDHLFVLRLGAAGVGLPAADNHPAVVDDVRGHENQQVPPGLLA